MENSNFGPQRSMGMEAQKALDFIKQVTANVPNDWVRLTTHRLDIYNESLAKTEFIDEFEKLYANNDASEVSLAQLPTAYDYIRLGHPLSSVLEWIVAKQTGLKTSNVICFSSNITPIMALLRKNLLAGKNTRLVLFDALPSNFDLDIIRSVYGYQFETAQASDITELDPFDGSTVLISNDDLASLSLIQGVDFQVSVLENLGSIILVNDDAYVGEIQHVRRRETIAMTPANCLIALKRLVGDEANEHALSKTQENKTTVVKTIQDITQTSSNASVGSSGLSIQYAITMGLVHHAMENHSGKDIKIVVPPNCYGGTNDQARRVAACLANVEVMDLPVDGDHNMVESVNLVLDQIAQFDAVPYIIAEIPTNPRVEVPNLNDLEAALSKSRTTPTGDAAIAPVFILDQTFCPNVHFLGDDEILASVQTISYVSGSKFPSGGLCTAGYCIANQKAAHLMSKIDQHLHLCDNQATALQLDILAKQMPSMLERIQLAYDNTRAFVRFIGEQLPAAKINFVSEELAAQTFTPSVFSLDLPTYGDNDEQRESNKRERNLKLINMMIDAIPSESKYCVSYGQLKGCYWTIPATSTQGTTKEGDKDYIVRVALSGNMDLEKHKEVFQAFVSGLN